MTFDEAAEHAGASKLFGEPVSVLSHGDLVRAKEAAIQKRPPDSPKRRQDEADLAWLRSLAPKKRE